MASHGVPTQRPVISSSSSPPNSEPERSTQRIRKNPGRSLKISFNLPFSPEEAAMRIIKNYVTFGLLYAIFIWIVLFIALIPARKLSLLLMAIMTNVASAYLFLLRAFPGDEILRFVDRRLVLGVIAIVTGVMLVLTHAGLHLLITVASGIPITLVHAILKVRADIFVDDEVSTVGELAFLVGENPKPEDLV